jgi:GNAT superfamily N-acetyltransferase
MKKLLLSLLALGHIFAVKAMNDELYQLMCGDPMPEISIPEQLLPEHRKPGILHRHDFDRQIVDFNEPLHGSRARDIFRSAFGELSPTFLLRTRTERDTIKVKILFAQGTMVGLIIYCDSIEYLGKPTRDIIRIAVDKPYQGRGYGPYLMEKNEENARNLNIDTIPLTPTQKSRRFYEKCGFVNTGTSLSPHMAKEIS